MAFFLFEAAVEIIDSTLVFYLRQWNKAMDIIVIANTSVSLFVNFNGVQVCNLNISSSRLCFEPGC